MRLSMTRQKQRDKHDGQARYHKQQNRHRSKNKIHHAFLIDVNARRFSAWLSLWRAALTSWIN
jgi:hypothetical protein